jgi:Group II intron, maturase-specific domain/Reverse transcriptase (RNA-dependent DNA polymerase)/HNH endonuclease
LANFTLNGLEETVLKSIYPITTSAEQRKQIKLRDGRYQRIAMTAKVVRYADDFIIIGRSKHLIEKYIKPAVSEFLKVRGLLLSPEKTKLFSLQKSNTQLDFLGYTFKYQAKWSAKRTMTFHKGSTAAIALYPNKEKVRNFIHKLKAIYKESQNLTAIELISNLNPIIRGWSNYYNMANSSHYRSVVRNALYNLTWDWMIKKHPTLGKKTLSRMYFLTKNKNIEDIDSPILPNGQNSFEEFVKIKNTLWVFHGISRTLSRYTEKPTTRIVYLLNPCDAAKILSAKNYIVPKDLKKVHAFHDNIKALIKFKLNVALMASPQTPTLKEKLFKIQKGLCGICDLPIDFDKLLLNHTHIHHIEPIKKGGNKYKLTNLSLTHVWCHRKLKH